MTQDLEEDEPQRWKILNLVKDNKKLNGVIKMTDEKYGENLTVCKDLESQSIESHIIDILKLVKDK